MAQLIFLIDESPPFRRAKLCKPILMNANWRSIFSLHHDLPAAADAAIFSIRQLTKGVSC